MRAYARARRKEVSDMPFGDGTGPRGMGAMTGRGVGYCTGFGQPGFASPTPGRKCLVDLDEEAASVAVSVAVWVLVSAALLHPGLT